MDSLRIFLELTMTCQRRFTDFYGVIRPLPGSSYHRNTCHVQGHNKDISRAGGVVW